MGVGIGLQTRFGLDRALADRHIAHVPLDAGGPVVSTVSILARAQRSLPAPVDMLVQLLADDLRQRQQAECSS
jgi:hypothetical protein